MVGVGFGWQQKPMHLAPCLPGRQSWWEQVEWLLSFSGSRRVSRGAVCCTGRKPKVMGGSCAALIRFCSQMEAGTNQNNSLALLHSPKEVDKAGWSRLQAGCIFQMGHRLNVSGLEHPFSSPADQKILTL